MNSGDQFLLNLRHYTTAEISQAAKAQEYKAYVFIFEPQATREFMVAIQEYYDDRVEEDGE